LNEEGIYPGYPDERTKRLYIVRTILDAATLLESKTLENRDAVMALFDGEYKDQHRRALSRLSGKTTEFIFVTTKEKEVAEIPEAKEENESEGE
jgi:hypothetical protein